MAGPELGAEGEQAMVPALLEFAIRWADSLDWERVKYARCCGERLQYRLHGMW